MTRRVRSFLWTSFTKPHPPFDPCRDFWELYDNIPMPDAVTGDWSRTVEETPQGFLAGSYENTNQHLFGKEQRAASKRAYYACITQIDYALGRIFGCLRENDLFKKHLDHLYCRPRRDAGRPPYVPEESVL